MAQEETPLADQPRPPCCPPSVCPPCTVGPGEWPGAGPGAEMPASQEKQDGCWGATAAPGLMAMMDVPRVKTGRGEAPLQGRHTTRPLQTHQVCSTRGHPSGALPSALSGAWTPSLALEALFPAQHHGAPCGERAASSPCKTCPGAACRCLATHGSWSARRSEGTGALGEGQDQRVGGKW